MDIGNIKNEYFINKYSKSIYLISSLLIFFPITIFIVLVNDFLNIFISIFIILLSSYFLVVLIPQLTSKEIIKIKFDAESLNISWIKSFWFKKRKEDFKCNLIDITSYKYEPSNNFDTFKIHLNNGKRVIIHRWYNDTNDDFDKFYKDFNKLIKQFNKKGNQNIINREQNIMEKKSFLIFLAILLSIILIVSVYFILTKGINNPKGIVSILAVLSSLVWLIHNIIKGLKQ